MENMDVIKILGYGIIGLGFLLALMAFNLLSKEQKKDEPNEKILASINRFMMFSIALSALGLGSEIIRPLMSSTETIQTSVDPDDGSLLVKLKLTDESVKDGVLYDDLKNYKKIQKDDSKSYCIVVFSPNLTPYEKVIFKWSLHDSTGKLVDTYSQEVIPETNSYKTWSCRNEFSEYPEGRYYFNGEIKDSSKRIQYLIKV
jgi:hypothetical protein